MTEAQLRALRLPTLIWGCDEDAIHPYSRAQAFSALISNSRLFELPAKTRNKATHLAALAAAMIKFLQGISLAAPH